MRAVFFDASGVIFENGTAKFIGQLMREGRGDALALNALLSGPLSWALRRGEIEAEDFWRAVEGDVRSLTGLSASEFREGWMASFLPHDGMETLFHDLAMRGHPIGIIAETTAERVQALERRFAWTALPRWKFWSFAAGEDKRDGALFRHAWQAAGPFAGMPIMIEDDEAAANQARRAGFEAVLFQNAETVRRIILDG